MKPHAIGLPSAGEAASPREGLPPPGETVSSEVAVPAPVIDEVPNAVLDVASLQRMRRH